MLIRLLPLAVLSWLTRRLARSGLSIGDRSARWLMWRAKRDSVTATMAGLTLQLDLNDNLQREVYFLGDYEPALSGLLCDELRTGDIVADVGANVGLHTLRLAQQMRRQGGGGLVLAFEPAPDAVEALQLAAHQNGLTDWIRVVPIALSDRQGTASLRSATGWHPDDLGVRSLFAEGDLRYEVPLNTFESWADADGLDRLDLIKIDVEGGELDVLRGMRGVLARLCPRLIVVEVVPSLIERAGSTLEELKEIFLELGYRVDGPGIDEIAAGETDRLWPNVVMRLR